LSYNIYIYTNNHTSMTSTQRQNPGTYDNQFNWERLRAGEYGHLPNDLSQMPPLPAEYQEANDQAMAQALKAAEENGNVFPEPPDTVYPEPWYTWGCENMELHFVHLQNYRKGFDPMALHDTLKIVMRNGILRGHGRDLVFDAFKNGYATAGLARSLTRVTFNKLYDAQVTAELPALYAKGLSPREISLLLLESEFFVKKCNPQAYEQWAVTNGQKPKTLAQSRAEKKEEDYQNVLKLWEEGYSTGQIARKLKIPTYTIARMGFRSNPHKYD
jgi:hypothetical protein